MIHYDVFFLLPIIHWLMKGANVCIKPAPVILCVYTKSVPTASNEYALFSDQIQKARFFFLPQYNLWVMKPIIYFCFLKN